MPPGAVVMRRGEGNACMHVAQPHPGANRRTPADVKAHAGSASILSNDRVVFNGGAYRVDARGRERRPLHWQVSGGIRHTTSVHQTGLRRPSWFVRYGNPMDSSSLRTCLLTRG